MPEPRRPRGRPPLEPGQRTTLISVRVTEPTYDKLYDKATRERVSVQDLCRRGVRLVLEDDHDG